MTNKSEADPRVLAEAVAYCALEMSGRIFDQKKFGGNLQKIIRTSNPRFTKELTKAITVAKKFSSDRIRALGVELNECSLLEVLTKNTLENLPRAQIKLNGATHTPLHISRYITRNAFKWWKKQNPKNKSPEVIGDLSVGVGSFLLALHIEGIGQDSRIIGIDSDLHSVLCCELLRISLGAKWEIYHSDSLLTVSKGKDLFSQKSILGDLEFDLLIGNPPYVRSSNLPTAYVNELRDKFDHINKGNFDLCIVFLEQAQKMLRPNGVFSYITSSKFIDSKYGESICNSISNESRVLSIENFGDAQVFPGFTTYVLILTVSNATAARRFHFTSFEDHDLGESLESRKSVTLNTETSLVFPWKFTTDDFMEIRKKLTASNLPLVTDYFSGIFQGVRTGDNEVFVVQKKDLIELESELLVPFVSGREIKRQYLTEISNSLVFPYQIDEFRTPSLIDEEDLSRNYKKIYSRLVDHKSQLLERSLTDGSEWYGYSRSQSLSTFLKPKLFVKEMMPRAEFAYDAKGEIAFGSGYALDASFLKIDDLAMWTAVLNTPILEFSLRNIGTQLHSGWFRILKHQLIKLRLPRFTAGETVLLKKMVTKFEENPEWFDGST